MFFAKGQIFVVMNPVAYVVMTGAEDIFVVKGHNKKLAVRFFYVDVFRILAMVSEIFSFFRSVDTTNPFFYDNTVPASVL